MTATSSNNLNQQQIQKEVLEEEEDVGYVRPPKKGYQQQQSVVQQQVQEEEYRAYDWPLNITNKQRLNVDPVVTIANQTSEAEKEKNEIMRAWPKSQIPNSFNDKNFTEPLNPSIVRSDILRDDEESYSFSSPGKKKNVKFDLSSEDSDGEFAVASDEEEISVASSESEGRKEDEFSTESFDDLNDSTQEFLANESDDSSLVKRKFRNPENFGNTDEFQKYLDKKLAIPQRQKISLRNDDNDNDEFQKYLDKKLAIPQRPLVSLRDFDDSADSDDSIFIKKKLAIPQWQGGRPDLYISKIQDDLDESDDHVYELTQKKRADDPPKKSFCSAKKLLIEEQKDKDGNDNTSKKSLALADEGISIDIDMTCEKVETNINNLTEFLESSTVRYQEEQLDVINCIKELVEHDALVIMVPNLLEAVSQNRLLSEKLEKIENSNKNKG